MKVITAPEPMPALFERVEDDIVFMAGGISGCSDWQTKLVELLENLPGIMLNPRRPDFPMDDPDAAYKQISWEHYALRRADAILFWFPCETLCPIVLYELGAWSMSNKPLFVGTHPEYKRRQDVEIQTSLVRKDVEVVHSLGALAGKVREWLKR